MTKHIFVTGGVVSSLGKGITGAGLAMLLKQRGYRVAMQKLDPYLNVDPGTMSPYQHGEVFVTEDGAETDLDLGHYERLAGVTCTKAGNYTSGRIYGNVIARERAGGYLGGTVQVIPHITDEIKRAMQSLHTPETDIAITEIGGTAGDIESLPFLEAARQFRLEAGRDNAIFLHLTLVPYIRAAKELKTKPSQHSVATLRGIGIAPDILVCRTEIPLEPGHFRKLSLFCNVPEEYVIEELDVQHSIYEVPLELARQELDVKVLDLLRLDRRTLDLHDYLQWLDGVLHPEKECTIATRSSTCCRTSATSPTRAARCGSAPVRAGSRRRAGARRSTEPVRRRSATATAMNSIRSSAMHSKRRGSPSPEPVRTGGWSRWSNCGKITPSSSAASSTRNSNPARARPIRSSADWSPRHFSRERGNSSCRNGQISERSC